MKKAIHYLRRQSEETRRHVLHIATIALGVILLGLWVFSLGANFSDKETQADLKADIQPFSVLKDNISETW